MVRFLFLFLFVVKINFLDRVLAAAWVKRLSEDEAVSAKIKEDYIKLLLFVLQRKSLAPPFTQHPNSLQVLEEFPQSLTVILSKKYVFF